MTNKKVIGLGGVARAGKDTFAAILENKLLQSGKTVCKIALAAPLKSHCDGFLKENLGISSFTQVPDEKLLIRPFLVWYGDAQRKRTNGQYWTDLASKTIRETNYEYYIVTDVRYDFYKKDELQWLKDEWCGILCHISKYKMDKEFTSTTTTLEKKFVQPANDHEALNDPKIKSAAHHIVEWPDEGTMSPEQLLFNPTLNEYVDKFMDIWIQRS